MTAMNKPRVMVMSDHSSLHTGFANVSRHILNFLFDTGKYELAEFGWFAPRREEVKDRLPRWEVFTTNRSSQWLAEQDKYGSISLESAVAEFKPQILLSIGDQWMVSHTAALRDRHNFVWVGYVPIDGMPHPPEWSETFAAMDICVAYGQWGSHVMRQRNRNLQPLWIAHGVDTEVFKPDPQGRTEMRARMGIADEQFLIGTVGRNQPRKQFPLMLKAFAMFTKPHAWCSRSGKPFLTRIEEFYINELIHPVQDMPFIQQAREAAKEGRRIISPFTGDTIATLPNPHCKDIIPEKENVRLYIHCALEDVGWNLSEQVGRYKLQGKVILRDDLVVALGVTDADLAKIYNAFDVFTLPTIGEGFGLPILEAMSCGVPLCVTNYSGHVEWCQYAGEMIKPITFFTEPITGIERALCDITDYVRCLDRLYGDKGLRKRHAHNGWFVSVRMDWEKVILPQWEQVIDQAVAKFKPRPNIEQAPENFTVEVL